MPYCSKCGAQMDEGASFCPKCGSDQRSSNPYQSPRPRPPADPNDSGSFGWAILGFLVPLVGLILFLVWIQTRPKSAKMAGLGALFNVIVSVVFTIVIIIFAAALGLSDSSTTLLWF